MDINACIEQNKQTAIELYGDRIDNNKHVKGTDIWFDYAWRIHVGKKGEQQ